MYQMNPPQPAVPPEMPREKKRLRVPQIMLIVLTLAFAAWYLITSLTPEPAHFATITADTIGSRYNGDCLIVRDEAPYDTDGLSTVEYIAEEGTTIYRGTMICNVYKSGFSTKEITALQEYRDQIKEYQTKLLQSEINMDARMEKLESEVMTRAREMRNIISGTRGNMANQETLLTDAIQNRQSYLREKYADDQRMTRLYDDEQSQLQRINSWTTQYVSSIDKAVVSFYSDGYEYGLTTRNYGDFTPAEVRAMINGQKPREGTLAKGKSTIYRLVKDGHWYVLMLIRDNNWNPVEGAVYDLKLENFTDTTVRARVMSFTRTGGELEVCLSVEDSVLPVLYVRTCTGILGDSVSSLAVPARAIYTQDNMPGVVVVDGDYEWFIPVNILDKRDGMVFIAAIQQGVLFEGQTVRLF